MSHASPLILSFGSINIDLTTRTQRLPRPGETVHAESYATGLGGKGANQAAAAARLAAALGVRVALAGRIGADGFGTQARRTLDAFGVDLSVLHEDDAHATGLALIGVDRTGENCITVVGGANMAVNATDVGRAEPRFVETSVLLLQLETPLDAVVAAARRVRDAGGRVILDPAPAPRDGLPEDLWPLIDVITPNETETGALTGITPNDQATAQDAAAALLRLGARAAIVKMGARGVAWSDGVERGFVPPFPVDPVDSVAAGDCFNAGLAVGLALGKPLAESVRIAAACGALATTRRGAAEAAPEWTEVAALLAD